jgi:hypothetical protein
MDFIKPINKKKCIRRDKFKSEDLKLVGNMINFGTSNKPHSVAINEDKEKPKEIRIPAWDETNPHDSKMWELGR